MGVLRSGGKGRKQSPSVSKYGTKPRPGRRLPKSEAKAASKTESSVMGPRQDDLPDIRRFGRFAQRVEWRVVDIA